MLAYLRTWEFVFHSLKRNSWNIVFGLATTLFLLLLCPVAELFIIRRIAQFFIDSDEAISNGAVDYWFLSEVIGVYVLVQGVYFLTRINRVKLINAVASSIPERENRLAGGWIRLIFLETTVQAIAFAQLIAIMTFVFYTNAFLGAFFVAAIVINASILLFLFSGEVRSQESMKVPSLDKRHQIAGLRMLSRTKATEMGVLSNGVLSATLMLAFIVLVSIGLVGVVQGVVMIFAIRFYASIVSLLSGSMMRLARAFVFSEGIFSAVTGKQQFGSRVNADKNSDLMDDL